MLVEFLVHLRVALKDGEDALHRGDADAGRGVDRVRGQMLDVVLGRKLSLRLGNGELVEFELGLSPKVGAVDEEEDSLGVRVLDESIANGCRRERLSGARRHLDE